MSSGPSGRTGGRRAGDGRIGRVRRCVRLAHLRLKRPSALAGWSSTQSLAADGAVESEQRIRLPRLVVETSAEGARRLGESYWTEVEGLTRGVVRPHAVGGSGVALRAFGSDLLRFSAPVTEVDADGVRCRYDIVGGVLARRPGGSISFVQTGGAEPELRSAIAGFHPRLAARPGRARWTGILYSVVQRRLHLAVSRRYFRRLLAECAP